MQELQRLGEIPGVIDYHIGSFKDVGDGRAFSDYDNIIGTDFPCSKDCEKPTSNILFISIKCY
ncbi:MAG: hypothetical protein R3B47_06845 [Bacteroidia bacterium]